MLPIDIPLYSVIWIACLNCRVGYDYLKQGLCWKPTSCLENDCIPKYSNARAETLLTLSKIQGTAIYIIGYV